MVQTIQLFIEIPPVAVHVVVDVPVVLLSAVLWEWTSLCSRSDKFQQRFMLDGPQSQSPTFLSSASEGDFTLRPRWRGRRESDSQAFFHLNSMLACSVIDKDITVVAPSEPPPPPPLLPLSPLPPSPLLVAPAAHYVSSSGLTSVRRLIQDLLLVGLTMA